MSKWKVSVIRKSYSCREIVVEANSMEEAGDKALDEAGDYLYSENGAEYELDDIDPEEIKDE